MSVDGFCMGREALRGVLSEARPGHVHEEMKPCSDDEGCIRSQLMGFMAACVVGPNENKLACRLVLGSPLGLGLDDGPRLALFWAWVRVKSIGPRAQ